ncbi:Zn(2)-C6 fungal-type domain-containing protein [Mycena venus]|uniref:Zn(2)-C6 fungal-type domain-containing protein n=1 Tax=Mycena venus TaxID=2733690 RepID=A0A8H7CVH9_9AGAR|nr:Zn(2)-C6 fungal-type domain-containing protein [Mycena venus]
MFMHGHSSQRKSAIVQHGKTASNSESSRLGPGQSAAVQLAARSIRAINEQEACYPDENERGHAGLIQTMNRLDMGSHNESFMGKSSGAVLVKTAMDLKEQYASSSSNGQPQPQPKGPRYTFSPPDLLSALVDLYFDHSNMYVPLLHCPTFKRALADNLHIREDKFGANVLSVCTIGPRFSDDPRAYDPTEALTCGWKFFSQMSSGLEHLYDRPKLYGIA